MNEYTLILCGVTMACAVALMLTSGTRYEKLCAALTAVAVVMCVLTPIKEILTDDLPHIETGSEVIADDAEEEVMKIFGNEIAKRAAAAVSDKYPDAIVESVSVTVDKADGAYRVSSFDAEISGDDAKEAREYLSVLLGRR